MGLELEFRKTGEDDDFAGDRPKMRQIILRSFGEYMIGKQCKNRVKIAWVKRQSQCQINS